MSTKAGEVHYAIQTADVVVLAGDVHTGTQDIA